MKRLLTFLIFAFFAISSYGQVVPNLPSGTVPFGTGLFRAPDGDIWAGSKFDGYTNLGNWQRVADSLGAKINWSDTTIIASKEWVEGKLNSLPPSGVLSVTGDGVDNTDPANPVLSYPDPADIGALAPGDNVSELTNDAGYLDSETDPVYTGDNAIIYKSRSTISNGADLNDLTTSGSHQLSSSSTGILNTPLAYTNGPAIIEVSNSNTYGLQRFTQVNNNRTWYRIRNSSPTGWSNWLESASREWVNNLPGLAPQTLSLGSNAGRLSISGGNSVDIASVAASDYGGAFEDFTPDIGLWPYRAVGGSTGYPATTGGGIRFNRNGGNNSGSFDIFKAQGTSPKLYYTVGLNGPWEQYTFASEEWVNNLPGLAPQTLSLGSFAGEISISGGNSVRLNSLFRGDSFSGDISELSGGAGFYTLYVAPGATGFPSFQGSAVYFSRSTSPGTNGSFMLFAPTGDTNKMYYTTGGNDQTWLPFQTFASEQHVAANYVTLGTTQTITGEKTFGSVTNFNGSNSAQHFFRINNQIYWRQGVSTAGDYIIHRTPDGGPTTNVLNLNRATGNATFAGTVSGAQAVNGSDFITLSQANGRYLLTGSPAGSITTTDIDKWNSAITPEDIGFGLHTDANGNLSLGTNISDIGIGVETVNIISDTAVVFQSSEGFTLFGGGQLVMGSAGSAGLDVSFLPRSKTIRGSYQVELLAEGPDDVFDSKRVTVRAGSETGPRAGFQSLIDSSGNYSSAALYATGFDTNEARITSGSQYMSLASGPSASFSGVVFSMGDAGSMRMTEETDGNLLIDSAPGAGIILRSPNDTKYLLTVDDDGNLTTTLVP